MQVQLNDNVNARLANPLGGLTKEQLYAGATDFCLAHGLDSHLEVMKRAALVAQEPDEFESLAELDETEKRQLREEVTHKWKHPKKLYQMVILNSLAAAVQGWDETAINGALLIFVSDHQSSRRDVRPRTDPDHALGPPLFHSPLNSALAIALIEAAGYRDSSVVLLTL